MFVTMYYGGNKLVVDMRLSSLNKVWASKALSIAIIFGCLSAKNSCKYGSPLTCVYGLKMI